MSDTPPYQRIVSEIRRRIIAGELRPGDRIPSARAITRDWGVAIATASRALAALQQLGLAETRPGVGTFVAGGLPPALASRPARTQAAAPDLTRDRIVAAAVDLVDAEGMSALSMRRVATGLGVSTMALYRHVRNRNDLILLMIDEAIGRYPLPADPPEGWRAQLELSARLLWHSFHRHPWLGPVLSITRPQLVPNALRHADWTVAALSGLGLHPESVLRIHATLFSFLRGLATGLADEAQAEQDTGLTSDEWMAAREDQLVRLLGTGPLGALLAAAGHEDLRLDLDSLFEFGLARLLDGVESYLADGATSGP